MGSLLGNLPSYDPHNFSQLRPSDPTAQPSKLTPPTYHPTHSRTLPPPNQGLYLVVSGSGSNDTAYCKPRKIISTEARNILLRQIYNKAEEKLRPKRAASDHLTPDHGCKQPRGAFADAPI